MGHDCRTRDINHKSAKPQEIDVPTLRSSLGGQGPLSRAMTLHDIDRTTGRQHVRSNTTAEKLKLAGTEDVIRNQRRSERTTSIHVQ